ncbi:type IV secretory system conjugative DNA transfer VirD4/TraG family protein [Kribbella orskensis]|uniref:Type IV secretory system conjugative DNA transfer VirD4/TraG family protein n=1 Tax=Kribbella orskensis TaxID=2512216 RepID=A0ABY2BF07_9ACTN|nr:MULTISPECIES: type IV secretory system conjugative DNA transfer family protein [Kribbella]TCN36860.1 type IV secretory system conjugative DNA transfer VirD4/TraG family protein [Kribbella sp. VKM Ac-2500]TCO18284.1 type IV secretory system conjugative DNA transfer VirD4/TraG family protein [Kribbella orskensis]
MVPRFTLAMVALLGAGVAAVAAGRTPVLTEAGYWAAAVGAVGVVTADLLFWRLMHGAVIAAPLWVLLAGAVGLRAGAPGGAAGWVIAAGVLLLVTFGLVAVNRPVGGGVAFALWLGYVGFLLRALPEEVQVSSRWWLVLVAAGVVAVGTAGFALRSRSSSRGLLRRLGRAGRVTDGLASGWDVHRVSSGRMLRKKAKVIRPSLAQLPAWQRRFVPLTELGTTVATVGWSRLRSSAEDHTATFAGPRAGKTGLLMGHLLDAPGAVIATSTKTDILDVTRTLRAKRGPVWVFDPDGLTTDGSTITFDPLTGCTDAAVVMDRAADLLDGVGGKSDDAAHWVDLAKQALTAVMHAAALGGYSMSDVQRWVAHPDDRAKHDVLYELRAANATGFEQQATQFFTNNERTRSSISTTIMPALSWLSVPAAAAAAAPGGVPFDVERLLAETGTVYLLGADDRKTAPLVTALTAHIARQAKALAVHTPGRRLDPQLTMVLDEAALICLIPLDKWTGDFGSRGITLHLSAQSRAQLRDRFGEAATGALMTNVTTKVLLAGTSDDDDLQFWSTLCGERLEQVATRDRTTGGVSVSDRRVAVLTPGQVAQLRAGQALIITRGMPPAIGRVKMAWKRRDLRLERFHNHRAVRWTRHQLSAVEDWVGARLLADAAWLRDQILALADQAAVARRRATRPAVRRVVDGLTAALTWLEVNDPARELIARLRLASATRRARAALAARGTEQPTSVNELDGVRR